MTRVTTGCVVLVLTTAIPVLAQRFDNLVRSDFFAGYRGDHDRLARGMETCEKALAANPRDAAALVWHGGGLFYLSGDKFRAGDWRAGLDMQKRGLKEMDDAVALAPNDLQTLIPRGATLLAGAPYIPDGASAQPLLQKAVGDYEKVVELQGPHFAELSAHSRGELLGGLATGYRLLGNRQKSVEYLKRIVAELPGTPYETKASAWLTDPGSLKKSDRFCIGCHQ